MERTTQAVDPFVESLAQPWNYTSCGVYAQIDVDKLHAWITNWVSTTGLSRWLSQGFQMLWSQQKERIEENGYIERRFKSTQRNTAQLFKDRMDTVVHHPVLSFAFPESPQCCPFCFDSWVLSPHSGFHSLDIHHNSFTKVVRTIRIQQSAVDHVTGYTYQLLQTGKAGEDIVGSQWSTRRK